MQVDWLAVSRAFRGNDEFENDAEGIVHEIAHVVDCCGKVVEFPTRRADEFPTRRADEEIDRLIVDKYGRDGDYTWRSDMCEIRASAVTHCVLDRLGLLSVDTAETIHAYPVDTPRPNA